MLKGLWATLYKEFIHIRRDPATLVISMAIPLLQLVIFGYAINTDVRNIRTAVYDLDQRRGSRELIERFRNTEYFRVVRQATSDRELNDLIVQGVVKVGIKIPPDYSRKLLDGEQATILVLIDGSDSSIALQALNVANAVGLRDSLRILDARDPRRGGPLPVEVRPKMLFNPDSRSANFMVPGLVGIILQNVTTILTAFAIVRERERGTLEQLLVTPVRPLGLMLGKLLPYGVIGFLETGVVLAVMVVAFRVPIHGSLFLLLGLSLVFLGSTLGLGLLISTVAENQMQAMQLAVFVILPSILLSGFMFPRDSMPLIMNWLGYLLPVTHFLEILRGIILRGAGLGHLWGHTIILALFGAAILVLSALRFRKRLG